MNGFELARRIYALIFTLEESKLPANFVQRPAFRWIHRVVVPREITFHRANSWILSLGHRANPHVTGRQRIAVDTAANEPGWTENWFDCYQVLDDDEIREARAQPF